MICYFEILSSYPADYFEVSLKLSALWTATVFALSIRTEIPGPKVIKLFSCSTQLSMKFVLLINLKLLTIANFFLINIAEHENFSANKYENAIIFIFISSENFMLSWVEHEKSFITLGPGQPCRPRWDSTLCSIWSGSKMFATGGHIIKYM